jgi:hypothetical protein
MTMYTESLTSAVSVKVTKSSSWSAWYLGICLFGSNYEPGWVSREFLAHHREETVLARLVICQGVAP